MTIRSRGEITPSLETRSQVLVADDFMEVRSSVLERDNGNRRPLKKRRGMPKINTERKVTCRLTPCLRVSNHRE